MDGISLSFSGKRKHGFPHPVCKTAGNVENFSRFPKIRTDLRFMGGSSPHFEGQLWKTAEQAEGSVINWRLLGCAAHLTPLLPGRRCPAGAEEEFGSRTMT